MEDKQIDYSKIDYRSRNDEELRNELINYLYDYIHISMDDYISSFIRTNIVPSLLVQAWDVKKDKCTLDLKLQLSTSDKIILAPLWDYCIPEWTETVYSPYIRGLLKDEGPMCLVSNKEYSCSSQCPISAVFSLKSFLKKLDEEGVTYKEIIPGEYYLSVTMPTKDELEEINDTNKTVKERLRVVRKLAITTGERKTVSDIFKECTLESEYYRDLKRSEQFEKLSRLASLKIDQQIDWFIYDITTSLSKSLNPNFEEISVERRIVNEDTSIIMRFVFRNACEVLCEDELYQRFIKGKNFAVCYDNLTAVDLDKLFVELSKQGIKWSKGKDGIYTFSISRCKQIDENEREINRLKKLK